MTLGLRSGQDWIPSRGWFCFRQYDIMVRAIENDLASIIRVNKNYNCGLIEGNDCVPIFKGTNHNAILELMVELCRPTWLSSL